MPNIKEAHFKFLDKLRESGVTNMFGAGPYVCREFGVSRDEARHIVMSWMDTFDGKFSVKDRVERANKAGAGK